MNLPIDYFDTVGTDKLQTKQQDQHPMGSDQGSDLSEKKQLEEFMPEQQDV
jgi:hypothetical protein